MRDPQALRNHPVREVRREQEEHPVVEEGRGVLEGEVGPEVHPERVVGEAHQEQVVGVERQEQVVGVERQEQVVQVVPWGPVVGEGHPELEVVGVHLGREVLVSRERPLLGPTAGGSLRPSAGWNSWRP